MVAVVAVRVIVVVVVDARIGVLIAFAVETEIDFIVNS